MAVGGWADDDGGPKKCVRGEKGRGANGRTASPSAVSSRWQRAERGKRGQYSQGQQESNQGRLICPDGLGFLLLLLRNSSKVIGRGAKIPTDLFPRFLLACVWHLLHPASRALATASPIVCRDEGFVGECLFPTPLGHSLDYAVPPRPRGLARCRDGLREGYEGTKPQSRCWGLAVEPVRPSERLPQLLLLWTRPTTRHPSLQDVKSQKATWDG